jgi:hypothetical protein
MSGSAAQLLAQSMIDQYGRTVKIVHGAAGSFGVEARIGGDEGVAVKGILREKTYPFPKGAVDEMRGADEERAPHRERTLKIAALSIDFVPEIDDRVIDGQTTYAVLKAPAQYVGEEAVTYELVLKPI